MTRRVALKGVGLLGVGGFVSPSAVLAGDNGDIAIAVTDASDSAPANPPAPPSASAAAPLPATAADDAKSFQFQYPENFVFFSKPAKTHQIEYNVKSEARKGYTIGVAVDPVRLQSLEGFGSPDFVGERVVNVEKGRDGVLSAELKSAVKAEAGGVTYYDIDYVNESKRGNNHYATRVAIRDGKLYTLEVRTKIADYAELEAEVRAIVSSFRIT